MKKFGWIILFLTASITPALTAQQVSQGRANMPSEDHIPDDVTIVRQTKHKPKAGSKKSPTGPSSTATHSPQPTPTLPPQIPPPPPALPPIPAPAPPAPSGSLTPGEILASVFHILKLPPPFESATIPLVTPARILLCDPNAYTGLMAPWQGEVTWVNKGQIAKQETITAPLGWIVLRWPTHDIGNPESGLLNLKTTRPIIAIESLWSDTILFGADIPKLLLKVAPNWDHSPRKLAIDRFDYRESILPSNVKDGLQHPQVGPVLRPFLQRAGTSEEAIQSLAGSPAK